MRISLYFSAALLALVALTGCRGRPHPDLFEPGDIDVWRTVAPAAQGQEQADSLPLVELQTTKGIILIQLYEEQAPESVANFLEYVEDGFFEGTIFHRIVPGFVIQGGGFTPDLEQKPTREPILNEAGNGLRNVRGSVAMARTSDLDSANSQFFINLVDNAALNGDGVTGGYAVFGRVYEGMDVVDEISLVETATQGRMEGVPVDPVVILSTRRIR
ncbi:MAG: peptidylprolyl isomerase [Oceanipulchritudo sp.]